MFPGDIDSKKSSSCRYGGDHGRAVRGGHGPAEHADGHGLLVAAEVGARVAALEVGGAGAELDGVHGPSRVVGEGGPLFARAVVRVRARGGGGGAVGVEVRVVLDAFVDGDAVAGVVDEELSAQADRTLSLLLVHISVLVA